MKRPSRIGLFVVGAVVLILITLYYAYDPELHPFPQCLFYKLTGSQCAGCGSQRMLHALLHGDFAGAWHYNAGIIVGMPILITMLIASLFRDNLPRLYNVVNSRPGIYLISSGIIGWWVLRNLF